MAKDVDTDSSSSKGRPLLARPPACLLAGKQDPGGSPYIPSCKCGSPVRDALFSKLFGTRIRDSNTYLLSTIISTRALVARHFAFLG